MSSKVKIRITKYGICAVFTALMVWAYLGLRDFGQADLLEKYRMLCDAFTVPGVLLLCVGGLCWASTEGALDGIGYLLSFVGKTLIPGKRKDIEKYGDYVVRKRENRKMGFGFLLISGAIVLAVALVFMVLFYSLYSK